MSPVNETTVAFRAARSKDTEGCLVSYTGLWFKGAVDGKFDLIYNDNPDKIITGRNTS